MTTWLVEIFASICSGLSMVQSVAVGDAVAEATVESESNVPAETSLTNILGII